MNAKPSSPMTAPLCMVTLLPIITFPIIVTFEPIRQLSPITAPDETDVKAPMETFFPIKAPSSTNAFEDISDSFSLP